jgi:hypothetical protein
MSRRLEIWTFRHSVKLLRMPESHCGFGSPSTRLAGSRIGNPSASTKSEPLGALAERHIALMSVLSPRLVDWKLSASAMLYRQRTQSVP